MLFGSSQVHTSPLNIWGAPAVVVGALVAHPAKRRTIAAMLRALMTHLPVSLD
jgi:hypothetical protein